MSEYERINHPTHYTPGKFEVINVVEAWGLGFKVGSALKYIARAGKKPDSDEAEDLKKAAWYLRRVVEARRAKTEGGMSAVECVARDEGRTMLAALAGILGAGSKGGRLPAEEVVRAWALSPPLDDAVLAIQEDNLEHALGFVKARLAHWETT